LEQLAEKLGHPQRRIRYQTVYELYMLGQPDAISLLSSAIHDEDAEIRKLVAHLLRTKRTPASIAALLDGLAHDKQAQVRRTCAESLAVLKESSAIEGLVTALQDRSKLVRRAAVKALGTFSEPAVLPGLIGALLGDADSYVRWEAAKNLEGFEDISVVRALSEALSSDENSYVRYASAVALGKILHPESLPALIQALDDENSYVRFATVRALGDFLQQSDPLNEDLVMLMLIALDDDNTHVWHLAAENLWAVGETAILIVLKAFHAPEKHIRHVALKGLLWLSLEYDDPILDDIELPNAPRTWGWWN
jgi:HEAT repeat protein